MTAQSSGKIFGIVRQTNPRLSSTRRLLRYVTSVLHTLNFKYKYACYISRYFVADMVVTLLLSNPNRSFHKVNQVVVVVSCFGLEDHLHNYVSSIQNTVHCFRMTSYKR